MSGDPIDALESGLTKLVAKAAQLESTIAALRKDPSRLTGSEVGQSTTFVPLLVMAEGFPVNPATSALLNFRLHEAGILQERDCTPLHVISNEELSLIEALVEEGHALLTLLRRHTEGSLKSMSLRDFLAAEARLTPAERPRRLQGPFERAWAPVFRAIGASLDEAGSTDPDVLRR
jgi:hypothetical protein